MDFYRLKKVLSIDKEKMTAILQPGIVWEALDRELKKKGLTLLTYPSCYPGSTVGGWLAQGGAGFGSYEAGWFRDTVLSARVVMASVWLLDAAGVDFTYVGNRENCCGTPMLVAGKREVFEEIMRLNEALEAGASTVLALCPCCEFQLRIAADAKKMPVEAVDMARFASSALDYDFPDPNPKVKRQWAVFEAMIALMTPQGFANLMSTMWPEMINAMPFGMGSMMRVMGKIPGALNLMKPMFPILLPRLLAMMMPKVMPTMLERVADRIPMPDYMLEQMPVLMPKVMDTLIPHMIGDVIPLVTQPMIDYLQGK